MYVHVRSVPLDVAHLAHSHCHVYMHVSYILVEQAGDVTAAQLLLLTTCESCTDGGQDPWFWFGITLIMTCWSTTRQQCVLGSCCKLQSACMAQYKNMST